MAGANRLYRVVRVRTSDLTTKVTKDTKVSDNYHSELRALRVLRGEYSVAFTRKRVVLSALVGFALLLMQTSAGESFAASANNIRIGYPQPSGAMLPLWVMAEAKLDREIWRRPAKHLHLRRRAVDSNFGFWGHRVGRHWRSGGQCGVERRRSDLCRGQRADLWFFAVRSQRCQRCPFAQRQSRRLDD